MADQRKVLVASTYHIDAVRSHIRQLVENDLVELLALTVDVPLQFCRHAEVVDEQWILIEVLKEAKVALAQRQFALFLKVLVRIE